jgi:hypothetical protein
MLVDGKLVCVMCYDAALRPPDMRVPGEDDETVHA